VIRTSSRSLVTRSNWGRVKGDTARIGTVPFPDVRIGCAEILELRHEFAEEALQAGITS
jgi:hypothetical protein